MVHQIDFQQKINTDTITVMYSCPSIWRQQFRSEREDRKRGIPQHSNAKSQRVREFYVAAKRVIYESRFFSTTVLLKITRNAHIFSPLFYQ